MTVITDAQRQAYQTDGIAVLRNVVDTEQLDALRAAIERDIANPGPHYHGYAPDNGRGRFHGNLRLWEHDATFREFCLQSALPSLAQQFFGAGPVNLLYDQLFVKEPGTENRTRWHNDQPYWPVSGSQIISFWVALDPVTAENGAMEFVRGSHLWDRWFQPRRFGDTSGADYEENPEYEEIPDIEAARGDYDIVSFDLQPGDCYAFSGMTVHGATGNTSEQTRRRGYTVRYTGSDARYDPRAGTSRPLHNPQLNPGDRLDSAIYPQVLAG